MRRDMRWVQQRRQKGEMATKKSRCQTQLYAAINLRRNDFYFKRNCALLERQEEVVEGYSRLKDTHYL